MFSFPCKREPCYRPEQRTFYCNQRVDDQSLFGKDDPKGKMMKVDNKQNFTVSGVIKDLPNNTRFKFDFLIPWSYLRSVGDDDSSWGNNSTRTYAPLKPNTTVASANLKMQPLKQKYDEEAKTDKWEMFLYPMNKWRLYSSFTNGIEDGRGRIRVRKIAWHYRGIYPAHRLY